LLKAALIAAFPAAWFIALDNRTLFDPDEGRYAEIPREMLCAIFHHARAALTGIGGLLIVITRLRGREVAAGR
jgi:hypothetical protein